MNDLVKLQQIIEGLLLASGKPLSVDRIAAIFSEEERPENSLMKEALDAIAASCEGRGYELKKSPAAIVSRSGRKSENG